MKQTAILAGLALVLFGLSGCSSSPADTIVQDEIKLMNEMADALEKKDEAKLKDIEKRGEELKKKHAELKVSEADLKAAKERNKDALTKAQMRMAGAMFKDLGGKGGLPGIPGLGDK